MKFPRIAGLLGLAFLCLTTPAQAFQNPILGPINDPDCIKMDGVYHLIEPQGGQKGAFFNYRTSTDLVNWSEPVQILKQDPGVALWQGSYYRDTDGKLYLYYATFDDTKQKAIRVARAQSFKGPFTDLGVLAKGAIDPFPLRDKNGTLWLYYKNDLTGQKGIWVQKMAGPGQLAAEPAKEILHPIPYSFEDSGYRSVEGPTVFEKDGLYFLLYSGGPYNKQTYSVGYAWSQSPDGPFKRGRNNPIMSNRNTPNIYSPGVPTLVEDGAGQPWLVYRQRETWQARSPRTLAIDMLDVSQAAQGRLSVTPTNGVALPDPVPLR